ncbi:MAG: NAD-dependent DNA ligase LigA [Verrucomicrobiaceae bacterium]|nr:NAD-dependent DNA ligase LigA [Verrucomicrobiaceae bacterium]
MENNEVEKRINELRKIIEHHEYLYRIKNAPEISDNDFDMLMHELRQLEAEYPQLAQQKSPAKIVGSDLSEGFESVAHLSPMLSLDNVFDTHELDEFDIRLRKLLGTNMPLKYSIEPKIDGAGVSAVYINGKLDRLLTRGDGEYGDDITKNSFVIKNLPTQLVGKNIPELIEIRGEAYMTIEEFNRLSALAIEAEIAKAQKKAKDSPISDEEIQAIRQKRPYANPRNLTAGTLKLLDVDVLNQRNLSVIFYSIGASKGFDLKYQSNLLPTLQSWGLPTINWSGVAIGTKMAFEKICDLEEVRNDFPFNTDGAVLKLDDCSLHAVAGLTSHAPRWAVAWKYRAQQATTKLKAITLQVGRTGAVTPVAELEPVFIDGSTISRATLHNANYISQKDIRVGDTVVIEKAGEIIPAVIRVETSERPENAVEYVFPTHCPECNAELKQYGEKMLSRCPNFSCPPQIKGRIAHFASRDCMDIKGLGESVVSKLVDTLGISSPADIYKLTKEDLLKLDKVKDKTAENLLEVIEKSKKQDLGRLIFALGILEIGERYAKELALRFGSLDALMNASLDEIKTIDGLGARASNTKQPPVRALSVKAFFDNPQNRQMIEQLRSYGVNFSAQKSHSGGLAGKIFVLTGTLKSMDRTTAKAKIEALGGIIGSSVTKQTNFLVSDGEIAGSKMQKAEKLGTKVILEDEFLAMLENPNNTNNNTSLQSTPTTSLAEVKLEQTKNASVADEEKVSVSAKSNNNKTNSDSSQMFLDL